MSLTIDTGVKVTLHFSLGLEDGQIIDSNFQDSARYLYHGRWKFIARF